jgi:hypothetical protein
MTDDREFCAIATSQRSAPFLNSLSSAGMPVESDALIDALPHEGLAIEGSGIRSALPILELDEGHIVDLGSRLFEVLHLPGHSVGSTELWEEQGVGSTELWEEQGDTPVD